MYDVFRWWWWENMDRDQRIPAMKSINSALRDMGYIIEPAGGKTYILNHTIRLEVLADVEEFLKENKGKSYAHR
jgi:hypothetical protein